MPHCQTIAKGPLAFTLWLLCVVLPKLSVSYVLSMHSLTKLSKYLVVTDTALGGGKKGLKLLKTEVVSSVSRVPTPWQLCLQHWLATAFLFFERQWNPAVVRHCVLVQTALSEAAYKSRHSMDVGRECLAPTQAPAGTSQGGLQLQSMLKAAIRNENQECQEVELGKRSWSVCWEG